MYRKMDSPEQRCRELGQINYQLDVLEKVIVGALTGRSDSFFSVTGVPQGPRQDPSCHHDHTYLSPAVSCRSSSVRSSLEMR